MIDFFTDPYKDELIYSAIARYHFYSGNVEFRDTLKECFGKITVIPTFEIGGHLNYLSEELGGKYTTEDLIKNHTIFPYYSPFIEKRRRKEILQYIRFNGGASVYTKLGIVAGSICKKESIYYCPICAQKDIEMHGEAYIHREHQLQGIMLCPHHGCVLEKYKIEKLLSSRLEYIRFQNSLLSLQVNTNKDIPYLDKHLRLASDSYYLLTSDLQQVSKESLRKRYNYFLYKKGLARKTGTIKQKLLYEEFMNYYGAAFLEGLECGLDYDNEYNWLKVISRKSKRASHPLRNLLLIEFLCSDIREFFDSNVRQVKVGIKKQEYSIDKCVLDKLLQYKATVLEEIRINTGFNRTELRSKLKKEYTYLYRYDKEWLFSNLPNTVKPIQKNIRVDWEARDLYYVKLLKEKYRELSLSEEPIRITKGTLAKPLGILVNIEKKLDKLPITKQLLVDICESVEQYQLRRCKLIIDKCLENDEEIKLWKLQRMAAVKDVHFNKLKNELSRYINAKTMGENNGDKTS